MGWLNLAFNNPTQSTNINITLKYSPLFLREFYTLWHLTGHIEYLNGDRADSLFIHHSRQVIVVPKLSMERRRLLKKKARNDNYRE